MADLHTTALPPNTCLSHGSFIGYACPYCSTGGFFSRWFILFSVIGMLLVPGCTDKRAPRPSGIDTTASGWIDSLPSIPRPDTTALDSLLDSLPQPPVSVDTLVTPPRLDTIPASIDTTPAVIVVLPPETTVVVTVPAKLGLPWGPAGLWTSSTALGAGADLFTASTNSDNPDGIVSRITAARQRGQKLFLQPTSGKHSRYLTDPARPTFACPSDGSVPACRFDRKKWEARLAEFNTSAIRQAVARGIADGTILGANILDEPQHKSWGGVITKALLDSMARSTKALWPGMPVGVSLKFDWRPTETLRVVDFVLTQYVASWGSVTAWRDKELAGARKNGVAVLFSLNILNGGAGFGMTSCPVPQTGGPGYSAGRCAMSPTQVRETAMALAPFSCALNLWQFDATYIQKPANRAVFKELGLVLAQLPSRSCRRAT